MGMASYLIISHSLLCNKFYKIIFEIDQGVIVESVKAWILVFHIFILLLTWKDDVGDHGDIHKRYHNTKIAHLKLQEQNGLGQTSNPESRSYKPSHLNHMRSKSTCQTNTDASPSGHPGSVDPRFHSIVADEHTEKINKEFPNSSYVMTDEHTRTSSRHKFSKRKRHASLSPSSLKDNSAREELQKNPGTCNKKVQTKTHIFLNSYVSNGANVTATPNEQNKSQNHNENCHSKTEVNPDSNYFVSSEEVPENHLKKQNEAFKCNKFNSSKDVSLEDMFKEQNINAVKKSNGTSVKESDQLLTVEKDITKESERGCNLNNQNGDSHEVNDVDTSDKTTQNSSQAQNGNTAPASAPNFFKKKCNLKENECTNEVKENNSTAFCTTNKSVHSGIGNCVLYSNGILEKKYKQGNMSGLKPRRPQHCVRRGVCTKSSQSIYKAKLNTGFVTGEQARTKIIQAKQNQDTSLKGNGKKKADSSSKSRVLPVITAFIVVVVVLIATVLLLNYSPPFFDWLFEHNEVEDSLYLLPRIFKSNTA